MAVILRFIKNAYLGQVKKKMFLVRISILGFHVTSEKTKIKLRLKILSFYPYGVKDIFKLTNICWPVFSSVDRFALKTEHVISQCVTSALFLGNTLRARKYRFALYFRVLSKNKEKNKIKRN